MNAYASKASRGKTSSSGVESNNAATLKLQFRRLPPPMMLKAITSYVEKRIIKIGTKLGTYQ